MIKKVAERPGLRLAVVALVSLFSVAWLFGPELVLSVTNVVGWPSPAEQLTIRFWKVMSFTLADGVVLYILLGKVGATAHGRPFLPHMTQTASLGLAFADGAGLITYANTTFLRVCHLSADMVGQVTLDGLLLDRSDAVGAPALPLVHRFDATLTQDNGHGRSLQTALSIRPMRGNTEGYALEAADVTDANRAGQRAALTGGAVESLGQSLVVCDAGLPGWPILLANPATERLTQFTKSELVGAQWLLLQGYEMEPDGLTHIREATMRGETASAEIHSKRKDGTSLVLQLDAAPIMTGYAQPRLVAILQRDVTEERLTQIAGQRALYHDPISSLLNRTGFVRALETMLEGPLDRPILCLRTDIHNFHEFNVAAGWEAGDALLAELGRRLSATLPGAAVGRVAGDEYAAAIPATPEGAAAAVEAVRRAVDGRYVTPGAVCQPSIAIGYTLAAPGLGQRLAMQQSAIALRAAGRDGMADTCRFDQTMQTRIAERRQLTAELQDAVANRRFGLEFMPEVDLNDGSIVAVEALLRWHHPLFGKQEPAGFIDLARQSGLIREIGEVVIAQAAAFAGRHAKHGGTGLAVAVNLSLAELRRPGLADDIERTLDRAGAPAGCLELDLDEDVLATATQEVIGVLERLRAKGVRLAIDDFGSGHSPLRFAERCPVDKIKVAPQFTAALESDGPNDAVFRAILDVGAAQGAQVVAEGVETEKQRLMLLRLGCSFGQGFLFTQPLTGDTLHDLVVAGAHLPLRDG